MHELQPLRLKIRERYLQTEPEIVAELLDEQSLSERERSMLTETAARTVSELRENNNPTIMESFLSEYGLSTREGVGLMCLAEALLRVPDAGTVDELIADKIEPSNWGVHLGKSSSSLVNASTWALLLTGQILDESIDNSDNPAPVVALRQLIRRLGEPVVRKAVSQAMKMLGKQFVLGQTIEEAMAEARTLESQGYTYSYDMLGEAARTHADAERYHQAYAKAIDTIASAPGNGITQRPGISVKLSALYPRYETTHKAEVMEHLLPKISALVDQAAAADIGLNIDAEEADRLDISLDIIGALLARENNKQWDGFGVVVQAYGRRSLPVLDWLFAACKLYNRKIMVRLVKGAYWDAEIKQAQELGLANFPVYTRKAITDLSYIVCAQRLLNHREFIYPQFATHNAHTVSTIRYLAGADSSTYEFQRLHGMGESLHDNIQQQHNTRCRIYAPVGAHVDLLAYLVRRLLENGANSSFVNQIVNEDLSPTEVARCPVTEVMAFTDIEHPAIIKPLELFSPERINSRGYRINDPASVQPLLDQRETFKQTRFTATPIISAQFSGTEAIDVINPCNPGDTVGSVIEATAEDVAAAIDMAKQAFTPWQASTTLDRAGCLLNAAALYEKNIAELAALIGREAGKHLSDAIAEVREAVDFLRYYAAQATNQTEQSNARGVIVCISPWNFPLAIFTGQIAAALAAGNTVLAKPAPQTPLIAARAVQLLHDAAIPVNILQLLPGDGPNIGQALISDNRIDGVCFTGSTAIAKHIEKTLSLRSLSQVTEGAAFDPMLIAETGGLNAMIADTTALTEQVVRDVLISAFQSAGQRCSALRMIYIQEEAEQRFLEMLSGALDTLNVGDPWLMSTDVGPVIDAAAREKINNYVAERKIAGQLIKQISVPDQGHFVGPAIIKVSGIEDLHEEIFGPVLHVATFAAERINETIEAINSKGFGLTFGLHTRIDDRVQQIVDRIQVGNVYVNRNQIGAVVGSQPFGGEGKSGTGPKAGGPNYLPCFYAPEVSRINMQSSNSASGNPIDEATVIAALNQLQPSASPLTADNTSQVAALSRIAQAVDVELRSIEVDWLLPGPTGESNRLSLHPRGRIIVLADTAADGIQQSVDALIAGCAVLMVTTESSELDAVITEAAEALPLTIISGAFPIESLASMNNIDAVALSGSVSQALAVKKVLAQRPDAIMPLILTGETPHRYTVERHVCIDTTAAGGNATLLASAE